MVWGTEQFYSTTAQVLPTLVIALAVEGGLLFQGQPRELTRTTKWMRASATRAAFKAMVDRTTGRRSRARRFVDGLTLMNLIVFGMPAITAINLIGLSFTFGEIAALGMIFLDMPQGLSYVAAPLTWLALILLLAAAVALPVLRWFTMVETLSPTEGTDTAPRSGGEGVPPPDAP
jgi:hypothetical protein